MTKREIERVGAVRCRKLKKQIMSKVTSSTSWRKDFSNLRCFGDIKLVLKFQKLPLINKNLCLKTDINQGSVQSRESGWFHYITYLSVNLESVSSLFKIFYRKLNLEGRGVVLIFLSWSISFWKKEIRYVIWKISSIK